MCTAVTFQAKHFYFGRNLDLEYSFHEEIAVTPRNYGFHFRRVRDLPCHYALIGMAYNVKGYPLYYEAVNEAGLGMAGLYFPGHADYKPCDPEKENVAPFELIPWILGQCASVEQAKERMENLNVLEEAFDESLPLTPLHWMIADRREAITLEAIKEGVRIYDNPVGVLTNNPPFEYHMLNLSNYLNLSSLPAVNRFSDQLKMEPHSKGMGAFGLPGDLSSVSRFVKAAFTKMNSVCGDSESEQISQFFHILGSVAQQRGCVQVKEKTEVGEARGAYEVTLYSCCCNADLGIYYYTTYENSQISAVDMHREDLEGREVKAYPMIQGQQIFWQNK